MFLLKMVSDDLYSLVLSYYKNYILDNLFLLYHTLQLIINVFFPWLIYVSVIDRISYITKSYDLMLELKGVL